MRFVDEQHVARFQRREDADEVLGFSSVGPLVGRKFALSSRAIRLASVVFPSPGGP